MNRTDSSCLCWKDIKCNQYSAQIEHMPEREAVLFALEWWSYHLFLHCLGSQDLNNFETMYLFKQSQPLIITSMQMQWLISVFYLWFILEYIIHPICLILVVIPMEKKTTQNYFDNHLGTKEKGEEKMRSCVSVAISIQTVSQNITQKNDWESGRFCNTGAICVLLKTLQNH